MIDIRGRRIKKGLSQEQLAQLCGVTRNTIIMIENQRRNPSIGTAKLLAPIIDCEWWELINQMD